MADRNSALLVPDLCFKHGICAYSNKIQGMAIVEYSIAVNPAWIRIVFHSESYWIETESTKIVGWNTRERSYTIQCTQSSVLLVHVHTASIRVWVWPGYPYPKLDDGWPESETCSCPALSKRCIEREKERVEVKE